MYIACTMKCSLPISVIVDKLVLNKGDICNTNVYNMTHSKHISVPQK